MDNRGTDAGMDAAEMWAMHVSNRNVECGIEHKSDLVRMLTPEK